LKQLETILRICRAVIAGGSAMPSSRAGEIAAH
jgi:hypothetical protein